MGSNGNDLGNGNGRPVGRGTGPLLRPTSQLRATLFVCLNLAAYALATSFLYYLGSGRWLSTTAAGYAESIGQPLGEVLLSPLSVFVHPWMILIVGLLLAVIIFVPLVVSCLYHSRYCALFLLCTAVLAHAPVMALVLAGGCMLVAATPLRQRSPGLALLMGLAPVLVYLYFSSSRSIVMMTPMQRLVLYVPFAIAALAALFAGGAVLLLAHWTRYRPGVVWPILLAMLLTPGLLFARFIGRDELAYARLAGGLTAAEKPFADWALPASDLRSEPDDRTLAEAQAALERGKQDRVAACDRFLRDFPQSRRLPSVLWIKGIVQDTQLSSRALSVGLARHYDAFPLQASEDVWTRLATDYPEDPRSIVACLRLAKLRIRENRLAEARLLLEHGARLKEQLPPASAAPVDAGADRPLFLPDSAVPSESYVREAGFEIEIVLWRMEVNGVGGSGPADDAFVAQYSLDPQRYSQREYRNLIVDLAERYVDTELADDFAFAVAMNQPDPVDRAIALLDLEQAMATDARIRANYELGRLALQVGSVPGLSRVIERPEVYFKRVQVAPANPWRKPAAEHLQRLRMLEGSQP